jgi:hypothetical protein
MIFVVAVVGVVALVLVEQLSYPRLRRWWRRRRRVAQP